MNFFTSSLLFLVAMAAICAAFLFKPHLKRDLRRSAAGAMVAVFNSVQTRLNFTTPLAPDSAHTFQWALVKIGGSAGHYELCSGNNQAIGVVPDTVSADELSAGDIRAVQLFGGGDTLPNVVMTAATSYGELVYTSATAGKCQPASALTTGTWWLVGRALAAASGANGVIPVQPILATAGKVVA